MRIDANVDTLDLARQGFQNSLGGVSAEQPASIRLKPLKLYLYGYINKVRSGCRPESKTHRKLKVIWLMETLRPSDKTIADFRKNYSVALTATNRDFVLLGEDLQLLGGETPGIDGRRFKPMPAKTASTPKTNCTGNWNKKSMSTRSNRRFRMKPMPRQGLAA